MKKSNSKSTKEEVIAAAMKIMTDITEESFYCYTANDDGGLHLVCAVERSEDDFSDINGNLPHKFMGWRSVILSVPNNYINTFLKNNGSK
tara:strand:- start:1335 stop:1604 length:270 start_codon:yes stop_codon:yes gene_type:complete